MLRTESKQIGEHVYKVTQLDAVKARAVFLRLAQILAPALEKSGIGADDVGSDALSSKVIGALAGIVGNIKVDDLDYFCSMFAPTTDVVIHDDNGKTREPKLSAIIALHFAGDALVHMFEWLIFCVEVNFGAFFAKLGVQRGSSGAQTTESK